MGEFLRLCKMQSARLINRAEAKYAFTIVLVIIAISFIETCILFYGADRAELPSASYGWIGNMDIMLVQTIHVLYGYFIFLISASVFADIFFVDVKCKIASALVSRCSLGKYLASIAILAFIGGFIVLFIPLLISQLLALLVFPVVPDANSFATNINNPAYDEYAAIYLSNRALFPSLYLNNPYLDNFLFIFSSALWAGVMALMAFTTSLFTRKSRIIVLGVPTIIYLVTFYILPAGFSLLYYLFPGTFVTGLTPSFFFSAPLLVLTALIITIVIISRKENELLL